MGSILYKDDSTFLKTTSQVFDITYKPGDKSEYSGMYQCTACKHIIVHTSEKPLPPQNHHQHPVDNGPIQWKLVVGHKN